MDCLIEVLDEVDARVIRVAGRFGSVHVAELLSACSDAPGPVQIDLTCVISVDPIGVESLRRLRAAGAELTGAPKYIELTLEAKSR